MALSREISGRVSAAYGGMRYRNDNASGGEISTDWVQIPFDQSLPLFGEPLLVRFNSEDKSIALNDNEAGVYHLSLFVNFRGEQGEKFTFEIFVDQNDGNGYAETGLPIFVNVSTAAQIGETRRSTPVELGGGWKFQAYVKSDKPNTTFDLFIATLDLFRISERELG